MKNDLSCNIVQDLLPNYVEALTSDESRAEIEHHLDHCDECRKMVHQMSADLVTANPIPYRELKFLRKIKRTRLFAAALCLVLSLGLSYLTYASEFKYINDKSNLSAAITAYAAPFHNPVNAYVLETKDLAGTLVVTFKDRERPEVNGVALFTRGMNQRYRIIQATFKTSEHSAVVQVFRENIHDKRYYIVSGYNLADQIQGYGIAYNAYRYPGYNSEDRVQQVLSFNVENSQFLELFKVEDLDAQVTRLSDETLYNYHLSTPLLFNAEGVDITDNYLIQDNPQKEVSHSIGTAERGVLYALIVMIMMVGIIMIRYFLTD